MARQDENREFLPSIRNPFREMLGPLRGIDPELDRFWSRWGTVARPWEDIVSESWPMCDLEEKDDHYKLCVDLPGMHEKDIDVNVTDTVLTIKGERALEREEGGIHERQYGAFRRSFGLPTNVNAEQIAADYTDGVLTLTLPKAQVSSPRRVEIKKNKMPTKGKGPVQ